MYQEKEVVEPEFHHIFKRLRDRISSVMYFYCSEQQKKQSDHSAALSEKLRFPGIYLHSFRFWLPVSGSELERIQFSATALIESYSRS